MKDNVEYATATRYRRQPITDHRLPAPHLPFTFHLLPFTAFHRLLITDYLLPTDY